MKVTCNNWGKLCPHCGEFVGVDGQCDCQEDTGLRRNLDTQESREFWARVDIIVANVKMWPKWMKENW